MPAGYISPSQRRERRRIAALSWSQLTHMQRMTRMTDKFFDLFGVALILVLFCWMWVPVVVIYGLFLACTNVYEALVALKMGEEGEDEDLALDPTEQTTDKTPK